MRRRNIPGLRRQEAPTLADIEAEYGKAVGELAEVEAEIPSYELAVEAADALDVDVRLGGLEEETARAAQAEAADTLRAEVDRRDRLSGVVEALRGRALEAVAADERALDEVSGRRAQEVDEAVAELDLRRLALLAEREAVNGDWRARREVFEETRRRLDPDAAAAHRAREKQELETIRWAARGGSIASLPVHLQGRAQAERERLGREAQESMARSLERNRDEMAQLGITVDRSI